MKKNKSMKETAAFIKSVLDDIDRLLKELGEAKGNARVLRRAKGSILHDFYNACERIFEAIAREVNGGVPATHQWHKKLLHQMTITVSGVRASVISRGLAADLDEYLAFRHVFRNIYGFELEGDRMDMLILKFPGVVKMFKKEIANFLKKS